MVKVKICGITNREDALFAVSSGADAKGFVFAESPRRITPEKALSIIRVLPPFITTVGLFVDESAATVEDIIKECRLDAVQFHGNETPDYCQRFCGRKKVIKAFRIKNKETFSQLELYHNVDAYLLDAYSRDKKGGTGERFDWGLAQEAKRFARPVILAGGLTVGNVKEAIEIVKPYAVDVSSGVEASPGKKDPQLLKEFICNAKSVTW